MRRVILFSTVTEAILPEIFNAEIKNKVLAYMPSDGTASALPHIQKWQNYAKHFGVEFNLIDNHSSSEEEKTKILASGILLISGGNTFVLLNNLRKSGLDKAVLEFAKKPEFILSGFSVGALVLTPSIAICNLPGFDENIVGITDLNALNIVDFEVFPHYAANSHQQALEGYASIAQHRVREIPDEDYIIVDM